MRFLKGVLLIGSLAMVPCARAQYHLVILDEQPIGTYGMGSSDSVQVGYKNPLVDLNDLTSRAYMWSGSAASMVSLHPDGVTNSEAFGAGGNQQVGRVDGQAGYWTGTANSFINLAPNSQASVAYGTDGLSQVGVIYSFGEDYFNIHASLWSGTPDSLVDLHPEGYLYSEAYAIDGGLQVGNGTTSEFQLHAMLWEGTAESAIDLNPEGSEASWAYSVFGQYIVGYAGDSFNTHATLWTSLAPESALDLHPDGFSRSRIFDLNSTTQVGDGNENHALVWHGTVESALDLNQFNPEGYLFSSAQSIDSLGRITGYIFNSAFDTRAVMWVPNTVPEPGSLAVLGLGVLALVRKRKKA